MDSERSADNDYTETCREAVRFVTWKCIGFFLLGTRGKVNKQTFFLSSYKDSVFSLLLFADTKTKGMYAST